MSSGSATERKGRRRCSHLLCRSGVAAIATQDRAVAAQFIDAYPGTGVFLNSTTRLLDGYKLLRLPETCISIDRVPGPAAR